MRTRTAFPVGDANRGSEGEAGALAEPVEPVRPCFRAGQAMFPGAGTALVDQAETGEGSSILEVVKAVGSAAERAGGAMLEHHRILRDEPGSAESPTHSSPPPQSLEKEESFIPLIFLMKEKQKSNHMHFRQPEAGLPAPGGVSCAPPLLPSLPPSSLCGRRLPKAGPGSLDLTTSARRRPA